MLTQTIEGDVMEIETRLAGIEDNAVRAQLRAFIDSGEASDEFLDLLDVTPEYQAIVDAAFEAQAAHLDRFAARLRQADAPGADPSASRGRVGAVVASLGRVFRSRV